MRILLRLAFASVLAVLLGACAGTKIVNSWKAPDYQKESVKKILVFGVAHDTGLRRRYEDDFAARLEKLGFQAIPGYLWAPEATKLDKAAIMTRIRAEGVTHVLVTRLVSTEKIETHNEPVAMVSVGGSPYGPGYYGGWSTYYAVSYSSGYTQDVTTITDVVTLETNLYDASRKEDDAIVWSGHSETMADGRAVAGKVDEVIGALVTKMRAEHVF